MLFALWSCWHLTGSCAHIPTGDVEQGKLSTRAAPGLLEALKAFLGSRALQALTSLPCWSPQRRNIQYLPGSKDVAGCRPLSLAAAHWVHPFSCHPKPQLQ